MYQPVLLYTTEEHGCSLTTFYVRVEQHEPTLLMIKTCNDEVSVEILVYFGFVFVLFHLKIRRTCDFLYDMNYYNEYVSMFIILF